MLEIVDLVYLCKELNVLPRAGGVKDQDSRDVWLMKNVLSFIQEREELNRPRPS